MPKRDNFHETVKIALQKEGWNITNDPLFVPTEGGTNFFIDLGIERFIGAEKEGENIAVEIKSFDETSVSYTFYEILGQFLVYVIALEEQIKQWDLYIAISNLGYKRLDEAAVFKKAIERHQLKFIIFEPLTKSIIEWKK